ncbi:MAG: hypothetical protein ACFFDR_01990 [Candidatus Thorarchaeota archaeon]
MGVKNWNDLIPWRWISADELKPRVIAIDAPNYLTRRHQAYAYGTKQSIERIPTSHFSASLGIIKSFLSKGFLPVFVFDGPPEVLKRPSNPHLIIKSSELYNRYRSTKNLFDTHIAEPLANSAGLFWYFSVLHIKELCSAAGIPAVTAASEAEMTAAVLVKDGLAGTTLSNDVDALLFGSPHVTRTIQLGKNLIERCSAVDLESNTKLDLNRLRDLAILCGCDFHNGVKGVGPRKGSVLLHRFGNLERVLKSKAYTSSEIEELLIAREVFEEPSYISTKGMNLSLCAPIPHQLIEILEPVLGREHAETQANVIVKLWKSFGTHQSTLEQWV